MARLWRMWRLLSLVKHAPDRLAHGKRRRATLAVLSQMPAPRCFLLICHGNVCRSPYAATALRQRLEKRGVRVQVESAGFIGPNRPAPADALAAALERGTDLAGHRSQLVSRALLDAADLIVVMNTAQRDAIMVRRRGIPRQVLVLGDLDPEPITMREIIDPWGKSRATFDACYDRIDRCLEELVRSLGRQAAVSGTAR